MKDSCNSEQGLTLADFTSPDLIVPVLRSQDRAGVIQELCRALKREGRVTDEALFYEAVMKREALASTDMERSMALPHARIPEQGLSFALGRSAQAMAWGTTSSPLVRLVFLMAVPEGDAAQYLALISALARVIKDNSLLAKLHVAPDRFEIFRLLQQIKLQTKPRRELPTAA